MKITEFNSQTGQETVRDMTDLELEATKSIEATNAQAKIDLDAKENAKAALLAKLGITADEAALLLA